MGLQVIGLVSGGKDSFFSLLHCLVQGHRVVALANLHPPAAMGGEDGDEDGDEGGDEGGDKDLDSFMYQTVGHQVVPLYGAATGLPLYRQAISGRAVQQGREYAVEGVDETGETGETGETDETDETESMTTLLQRVMARHPEADAVCAGAILSTYQRTRVESVATRLGLTSLAYLWQLPRLPSSSKEGYLADVGAAGLDARIVKVASGGLDEAMLWADVGSSRGRLRLQRALERFGFLGGNSGGEDGVAMLLGEGGEYETLVVDGPRALFGGGAVAVAEDDCRVVREDGGSAWLQIGRAAVAKREEEAEVEMDEVDEVDEVDKTDEADKTTPRVRVPAMLDARFESVLAAVGSVSVGRASVSASSTDVGAATMPSGDPSSSRLATWCIVPTPDHPRPIADATRSVVDQVRARLQHQAPTRCVVRTIVVLRRMADFAAVNAVYGSLFGRALPNPPARVAVACGDRLPEGVDVAVYLTVLPAAATAAAAAAASAADRQGLHVQSRSYWAPANIGPYSQAVSVPLANGDDGHGPRLVCVAGQIPLVPATMELPDAAVETRAGEQLLSLAAASSASTASTASTPAAPASFGFQATLALQHLWRIGTAVGVQWWTSAVAYVPRQGGDDDDSRSSLSSKAVMAAQAWRTAHAWRPEPVDSHDDDDDDDDGSGPDLWDRHFDARHYRPGGDSNSNSSTTTTTAGLPLPDWTALRGPKDPPPVFLAEVDALPRAAPVEWHAHAGLSQVAVGGIGQGAGTLGGVAARRCCTVVDAKSEEGENGSRWWQTVHMWPFSADRVLSEAVLSGGPTTDVVYVDLDGCSLSAETWASVPVVPCVSLWDGDGQRLAAVVVQSGCGR